MKWMALLLVLLFAGCTVQNGATTVDPNVVSAIEGIAEGTGTTAVALTPILGPLAAAIGGVILGGLRVWRKMKPELMEAKGKQEIAYAATSVLVKSIEQLKKDHPEDWDKHLEPIIHKAIVTAGMDPKVVENVIRAIRGLPPKG